MAVVIEINLQHRQGAKLGQNRHQHSHLEADERQLQKLAQHVRPGRAAHPARAAYRRGHGAPAHTPGAGGAVQYRRCSRGTGVSVTGLLAQPEAAQNAMPTQAIAPEMVTNLAAFKAYAYAYLMAHPRIAKGPGMFLLARTLEPSAN